MKLTNGFEVQVDEQTLHDWEVVELICELENGNSTKLPALVAAILGEDQKKGLVAHIKAEKGRCTVEDMAAAMVEIFQQLNDSEKK